MSKPPDDYVDLSPTLGLSEYTDPRNGSFGFWLYDETRGMMAFDKAWYEPLPDNA